MKSEPINIILRPDDGTTAVSRLLGELLGKRFDTNYTVSDKRLIPHATIYQAQYPVENYEKVREKISEVAKSTKPMELHMKDYEMHAGVYAWWNISKTKELNRLHYGLLELSGLRNGLLLPFIREDMTGYKAGGEFDGTQKRNVEKYGAVVVAESFQPHVTLGNLKQKSTTDEMRKALPPAESRFTVDEIQIGEMGDHGTVLGIRDSFKLRG